MAILELLKDFLSLSGFYVFTVRDSLNAMEILKKEAFDIIITDWDMPGINGLDLTGIIRAMYPEVFIIGMSADRKERDFLMAGADIFLSKPFQLSDVLEAINKASG